MGERLGNGKDEISNINRAPYWFSTTNSFLRHHKSNHRSVLVKSKGVEAWFQFWLRSWDGKSQDISSHALLDYCFHGQSMLWGF